MAMTESEHGRGDGGAHLRDAVFGTHLVCSVLRVEVVGMSFILDVLHAVLLDWSPFRACMFACMALSVGFGHAVGRWRGSR